MGTILLFLSLGERMFVVMEWTTGSTDQIEQRMLHRQAEISRLVAAQLADLEEIDYRQVAGADGCKSLSEWVLAGSTCPRKRRSVWSGP